MKIFKSAEENLLKKTEKFLKFALKHLVKLWKMYNHGAQALVGKTAALLMHESINWHPFGFNTVSFLYN